MKISAYNVAIGVEQRRYPYRAAIQSALVIADEFCVAYDPKFDDPAIFTSIDERVRPVCINIDFTQWDFLNVALTAARRACKGDWCLYLEADEVLHEKDADNLKAAVKRASDEGLEAVNVRYVEMCHDYVPLRPGGGRQKLIVNKPCIYHKTSDYMVGYIDSEFMDGKYIRLSDGYDSVSYFDERTQRWFNDPNAHLVEDNDNFVPDSIQGDFAAEVEYKTRHYTYVWHYAVYNRYRKDEQTRQTGIWRNRVWGTSGDMDIPRLESLIKETIVLDPERSRTLLQKTIERGWVKVDLEHPACARSWLDSMSLDSY